MSFSIDLIVIVLLNNFCHRFHILSSFIFWLRQVRGYQTGKKASAFSNIYPLPCYHACRIGWSDFWKKLDTFHIVPKFQNFTLKCCFLAWCRASENVDCYPKMVNFLNFILHFERLHLKQNVFLSFFKSKKIRTILLKENV